MPSLASEVHKRELSIWRASSSSCLLVPIPNDTLVPVADMIAGCIMGSQTAQKTRSVQYNTITMNSRLSRTVPVQISRTVLFLRGISIFFNEVSTCWLLVVSVLMQQLHQSLWIMRSTKQTTMMRARQHDEERSEEEQKTPRLPTLWIRNVLRLV